MNKKRCPSTQTNQPARVVLILSVHVTDIYGSGLPDIRPFALSGSGFGSFRLHLTRGDQKVLGLTYSPIQNEIKIVFASYISKAQNKTCTIWLLGYKYIVHFSGRRFFAFDMEKTELHSVMK